MRVRIDEPSWWYGATPSVTASVMAGLLSPLAALYGWAVRMRYARATPYRSRLPVVCVGNLTAGGTGKTPLTLHLCAQLQAGGLRPAILTRGVRRGETLRTALDGISRRSVLAIRVSWQIDGGGHDIGKLGALG